MGYSGCNAATSTVGLTQFSYNPSTGHVIANSMTSEVDSECRNRGLSARTELVCHEMGHTLSLGERGSGASSCMRTGIDLGTEVDGDASDFADLHAAYNHND